MIEMEKEHIKVLLILGGTIVCLIFFAAFKNGFLFSKKNDGVEEISSEMHGLEENSYKDLSLEEKEQETEDEESQEEEITETVKIYLAGQIENPGVYELAYDSRLNEAVELAGGLLEDADLERVNLALKVIDEGMYLIPKIGEEPAEKTTESIEDIDIPEKFIDVARAPNKKDPDEDELGEKQSGKVNINKANQKELETLPRIGPVTAQKIIKYRNEKGLFKNEKDLLNVSGIGPKTYEGLKDLISIK